MSISVESGDFALTAEEVQAEFGRAWSRYENRFSPGGDNTALRAMAFFWFKEGLQSSQENASTVVGKLARALGEGAEIMRERKW